MGQLLHLSKPASSLKKEYRTYVRKKAGERERERMLDYGRKLGAASFPRVGSGGVDLTGGQTGEGAGLRLQASLKELPPLPVCGNIQ